MHYFIFKKYPYRLKSCNVTESKKNYSLIKCPWSIGRIGSATDCVQHSWLTEEISSALQFWGVEGGG